MKNLIFSALFLLFGMGAQAQASLGFANTSTPGLADTVLMSSTVTYGVTIMNTGNQTFSGSYAVVVAVLDTSNLLLDIVDSTAYQTPALLAGDSAQITISHDIDQTKFLDGNNTVVIWPWAPGFITTDSLFTNVFVITFEGTDELTVDQLNIYPNPVASDIYIKTEFKVESVRILNINGRELISTQQSYLSLMNFENGFYIVEVQTENGKILRKKIIVKK